MADAKKYEQIALAQGQADAIALINQAMAQNPAAAEFLLAKERIMAFNEMGKNPSKDKFIVPYETKDLIGALSIFAESFKKDS